MTIPDRRRSEPTLLHTIDALRDDHATGFTYLDDDHRPTALTWAEVVDDARARAAELLAAGLVPGDRVGLLLTDTRTFVSCFLGALRAGLVPIPLAPPFRLDVIGPWCDGARRILALGSAVAVISERALDSVAFALVHGPTRRVLRAEPTPTPTRTSAREPIELPSPDACPSDRVAFLQFTSGSTSEPKGVRTTHANLAENTHVIMAERLRAGPDDVGISWLPLFHDMGLIGFVIAPLRHRMPTVFFPAHRFVMRPALWMQTVAKYGGTVTFAPNFAFALAVRRTPEPESLDLSRLRVAGCGAEPIDPRTLARFVEHFAVSGLRPEAIMPCYGMAEATLAISFDRLDRPFHVDRVATETYRNLGRAEPCEHEDASCFVSCGEPMPGHAVSVLDPEGAPLPERCIGELYVTGPSVTAGYDGAIDASAQTFTTQGLRTGDLGYVAEGRVYVTGRRKDLLILAGRNYDPQDIERQVGAVEHVREGNVVAFAVDRDEGEALVVIAETRVATHDELAKAIRLRLQQSLGLRVHDVLLVAPGTLPKTTSGKLQRARAQALYLADELGGPERPGRATLRRGLALAHIAARSAAGRLRTSIQRE